MAFKIIDPESFIGTNDRLLLKSIFKNCEHFTITTKHTNPFGELEIMAEATVTNTKTGKSKIYQIDTNSGNISDRLDEDHNSWIDQLETDLESGYYG